MFSALCVMMIRKKLLKHVFTWWKQQCKQGADAISFIFKLRMHQIMWNYRHLKAWWETFLPGVKGAVGAAGRNQEHLVQEGAIGPIKPQRYRATCHIQARIQLVRGLFVSSPESDCREHRVTSGRCRAGNWTRSSALCASWRRRRRRRGVASALATPESG